LALSEHIAVCIAGVNKSFGSDGSRNTIFSNFNLKIPAGQLLSVFGPNGCGKSTLIAMIAGFLTPDSGIVVTGPGEKNLGVVFQNYDRSLLPWRNCVDNVALPLEAAGLLTRQECTRRARAMIEELEFQLPLERYPYQMSGGQKQLTCIARAMVRRPALLLLDEPFSSLDYKTRIEMQTRVQEICVRDGMTAVFVSHELDEAIYVADRLIVIGRGPANILSDLPVGLPRPRNMQMVLSPSFAKLRSEVLCLM
jgi:NitT/TauT family transport system ATP-binding protein